MKRTLWMACLLGGAALSGCGGGSDDEDDGPPPVATYEIGGTVSGLDGTLVLAANEVTLEIDDNGSFTFAEEFDANTDIVLTIEDAPETQDCVITSDAEFTIEADVDDVTVECGTPGAGLSGTVINYFTGEPIDGATVTVSRSDGDTATALDVATTGEDGVYSFDEIATGTRLVITASADGYSSDTVILAGADGDVAAGALKLLNADLQTVFDPTVAQMLTVDGAALVELPAGVLVDGDGTLVADDVSATLTILDPSGDTEVMPGVLETLDTATGETAPIESWGAIDVRFATADGEPLNLVDGSQATIRIPLANARTPQNSPATVPLYWYDEARGYWVEDGVATLTETEAGWAYVGSVTHFTTWNADQVYNTVEITGCAVDDLGEPVANATVFTDGLSYIGSAQATTDAEGAFSVAGRIDSTLLLAATAGGQSQTVTVETNTADVTLDGCLVLAPSAATMTLTWGENPRDLDSHFFIPDGEGGELEVDYGTRSVIVDGTAFTLDVDDTSSFGPEVVTAPRFPLPGLYRYVVHHYSGSSTIVASPTRVELNLQGETHIFSPTQAYGDAGSAYWHVFDILVDDTGDAQLQILQVLSDSDEPPPPARAADKAGSTPARKHYAH